MTNTVTQQGRFTSDGTVVRIALRGGVDWMKVYNITAAKSVATSPAVAVEYVWFRGFPDNEALTYRKGDNTTDDFIKYDAIKGFTYYDSSSIQMGPLTALAAISGAATPVVTAVVTTLSDGDIVRIYNVTGGQQLGGLDFQINNVGGGTFDLTYMAQIAAANGGFWRKIPAIAKLSWYPRHRFITDVEEGQTTVIKMSVDHGYQVGQEVRFSIPKEYEMVELNGLQGSIIAIDTTLNTIEVDIDSSTFTAFVFPTTAANLRFTPAMVVPIGESTATALALGQDILSDATINETEIGMILAAGLDAPAGESKDQIYWQAGTCFSVDNQ